MNLSKPMRRRDEAYLRWIRLRPCTVPHCSLRFLPSEANHIRKEGHGGLGTKPDDSRTLPFCSGHHREYHRIGRMALEDKYSIELETEIKRLNALYLRESPKAKAERKPRETVAVHLKHCLTCARSVKRCRARNRVV